MRILLTSDYYWPYKGGGVEVVVQQLAERLVKMGHDVGVITLKLRPAPSKQRINGVDVFRMAAIEFTALLHMQLAVPLVPWQMASIIHNFRPDVIHIHNRFYTTSVLATLFKGHTPSIFTLHLGSVSMGKAVKVYEKIVSMNLLRASTVVTAVSDWASQVWPGCVVVLNGIDTELFHPASPDFMSSSVLSVGRLIQNKGPQRLLEAVPFMDQRIQVVFVGDGPMRKDLEKRAEILGLTSRVHFLGETPEVYPHLSQGFALARLSDTEGMSLSVLEALACGLPVVASPVAAGNMVKDGQNGFIVDPKDPRQIADSVNHLYSDNQSRWKMALNARATAEQYSWDKCLKQYESIYLSIAD